MTKNWKEYRDVITRLYISESRTLDEVRDIMQKDYNFRASSYRQQFDKWNLGKYNCKKRNGRRQQQMGASPNLTGAPPPVDYSSPESLTADMDHQQDVIPADMVAVTHCGPYVGRDTGLYSYAPVQAAPPVHTTLDRNHWEQQRWRAIAPLGPAGLPSPPADMDTSSFFQMPTTPGPNMELVSPQPVHPQQYHVLQQGGQQLPTRGTLPPSSRHHRYAPYQYPIQCRYHTSEPEGYDTHRPGQ